MDIELLALHGPGGPGHRLLACVAWLPSLLFALGTPHLDA